jgi:hypothetical protein
MERYSAETEMRGRQYIRAEKGLADIRDMRKAKQRFELEFQLWMRSPFFLSHLRQNLRPLYSRSIPPYSYSRLLSNRLK